VGSNFGGLWIAFIGWFLLDASRSSYAQVELMSGLRGRRVADIMQRDCAMVEGYLNLREFVDEHVLHSTGRCFVVMQHGNPAGIVTPAELRKVPREEWTQTSVQSIMRPFSQMRSVSPDTPALKALELMSREQLDQLLVIWQGKLEGIFSRAQVLRFLQVYSGLGPEPPEST
jgi:predicted transcriptional regulator